MNLKVLYKDDHFVAVEKPSGLLVHPYWKETNEKASLLKELKAQIGQWLYPVHRLDRPVSGVVIFGLASEAVKALQECWRQDQTRKIYLGLAKNIHTGARRFDIPLNNENKVAQEALTLATPIETFADSSLMEIEIKTGRKHQIRRHFSKHRSQIIGDRMYGKKPINDFYQKEYGIDRIFLHAHKLSFRHPFSGDMTEITSPLPEDLALCLEKIRKASVL